MQSLAMLGVAALAAAVSVPFTPLPLPSDQSGVYGIVDKVVLMPSAEAPTRVEIWGVFCVAEGQLGDAYGSARGGYLLFEKPADKGSAAIAEWRDLQTHAGSGKVLAFGSRYQQQGVRVWRQTDPQQTAAAYPAQGGVRPMGDADYGPVRQLRNLPRVKSPLGAGAVAARAGRYPAQKVTLTATNARQTDAGARYLFELRRADGSVMASPAIAPGNGETSWEVEVALQPGELVTWQVRVLHDKLPVAPADTGTFVVGAAPAEKK